MDDTLTPNIIFDLYTEGEFVIFRKSKSIQKENIKHIERIIEHIIPEILFVLTNTKCKFHLHELLSICEDGLCKDSLIEALGKINSKVVNKKKYLSTAVPFNRIINKISIEHSTNSKSSRFKKF